MLLTESQLRLLIQKSFVSEGFFDKVKKVFDPNFHKQVKQMATNVANKHGYQNFSDVPTMPVFADNKSNKIQYGQGLTLEKFLEELFVNHPTASQNLVKAWYNYSQVTGDLNAWINAIVTEIQPVLIEYLALPPSSIVNNPIIKSRFYALLDVAFKQVSSSTKYFAAGQDQAITNKRAMHPAIAFEKVKEMIKPNLAEEFETLIPAILRPAF